MAARAFDLAPYATGAVTSADGTTIGYRRFGHGPGVVLVHGGMQAAQNFTKLALALADTFTVYVPDRRGRGLSGPFGPRYCMDREREDLSALLSQTGATDVFGLSSGALIVLRTALSNPSIRRVALYEPPFPVADLSLASWGPRFDDEVERGDLASALVTALKATGDPSIFTRLPRRVLTPPLRLAFWADRRRGKGDDVSVAALIPTLHYDVTLVRELLGTFDECRAMAAEVLLLGGSRSQPLLRAALDSLAHVIPRAVRIELPGVGHVAADNDGKPALVARELRRFFRQSGDHLSLSSVAIAGPG
jgi:pimeloyl-ACP methyl ester carboxylesterase